MPKYANSFRHPEYDEKEILDENGKLRGKFRLKPSRVLWKPAGKSKYYSVPLNRFCDWIMSDQANANRTTS